MNGALHVVNPIVLAVPCLLSSTLHSSRVWRDRDSLTRIPLFAPRIAVVVVAAHFPESGLVLVHKRDAANPLGTLPEVEVGYDQFLVELARGPDRVAG